jgi:hypothetical protein
MGGSWLLVRFLVCRCAAADGPVPAYSGPESFMQACGSDASMVTGSATSGSTSSMPEFGPVPTSYGPVLESSGPKSYVQASLPFDQASLGQPIAQAFFLGVDTVVKVDSTNEGSSQAGVFFGTTSLGAPALGERLCFSLPVIPECGAPIYPSESKSVLRYYCRSKEGRGA